MPEHHCWECREWSRFIDGHYQHVPWRGEAWTIKPETDKHFVHVSRHDPQLVAYTASPEHGEQDRQTRVAPGRYLSRFYGDVLTQKDIQYWCGRFKAENGPMELKFATTPDAIVKVYLQGPDSCMAKPTDAYASDPVHPCYVYGAGDLAVAYVGSGEKVSARCICWPEKKVFGRIYGDVSLLQAKLGAEGYSRGGSRDFDGARLLRVEADTGLVCPYLDVAGCVDDDGEYLRISCIGQLVANSTEGTISAGAWCPHCAEHYQDEDGRWVENAAERWCPDCADGYTDRCDECERRFSDEHLQNVCEWTVCVCCLMRHYAWCEVCEEYHRGEACPPDEEAEVELVGTVQDERQADLVFG